MRDYPFGVEPCGKRVIDALSFVDLLDVTARGFLIAHSGTQYFKRRDDGAIANLACANGSHTIPASTAGRGCASTDIR
jgi:hypothetical protein